MNDDQGPAPFAPKHRPLSRREPRRGFDMPGFIGVVLVIAVTWWIFAYYAAEVG